MIAVAAIGASVVSRTEATAADQSPAKGTAAARSLSHAFRSVADSVLPAVVSIETRHEAATGQSAMAPGGSPFGGENPFRGTPFEDLFPNVPRGRSAPGFGGNSSGYAVGLGSGVIIDADGVILTNNHVVEGGDDVRVRLHDGREFQAADVLTDPKTDLAIIRIKGAANLTAAPLGDSDDLQVGDWVLALGQPFGLESTVTAGIVSATHRGLGITARGSFIQTDAAINPGNSGGPLVNLDGEVVGINTAISSRGGGNDGVGFAVPSNLAKWVGDQLVSSGNVQRAYLGVGIQPLTQELATQFDVAPREGVVVTQVMPDTPAAKMGLRAGDVITQIDKTPVTSAQDLQLLIEQTRVGATRQVMIVRDDKPLTLTFMAEAQPADYGVAQSEESGSGSRPHQSATTARGMELSDLTPDVARQLGVDANEGVVVTGVVPNSPAARAGIEPGMIIRQIARRDIANARDAKAALRDVDSAQSVLVLLQTSTGSQFVVIES